MITIIYYDHDDYSIGFDFPGYDLRKMHPINQMMEVKSALMEGIDKKFVTNHREIYEYVSYLIRTKQVEANCAEVYNFTSKHTAKFSDKGELTLPYICDVDDLSFGILFGKKEDEWINKLGLNIK